MPWVHEHVDLIAGTLVPERKIFQNLEPPSLNQLYERERCTTKRLKLR